MRFGFLLGCCALFWSISTATSIQGIQDLVKRRVPDQYEEFVFTLDANSNSSEVANDTYTISTLNGSIAIQGTSLSALATGLRRYFTDVAHSDIYWFIGNHLDQVASPLPRPTEVITGESIVPWRYHFNTVTFSYTSPFWNWSDWELELDWLALHGVNLPLAWVGFEKILLDVFRDINLTDSEILPFFSGPAFQAWNRFGNIQGSWGGELPLSWIDGQFDLQKKIITRMLELGMTPILPAFTGFVPRAISDVYPNASIVNGSRWEDFPLQYTNTTFLEPADPLFADLQNRVISKQIEYYGDITSFYTLDQYNENDPYSGDLDYLRNATRGTWQSLKAADADAVWVMQGWLFYSNSDFWTNERIEAFLSGVEEDADMLILDLFSESQPQWQRTNSYYGKPWVWCELHNYGGNMGLYGQVDNVTGNPVAALANSSSMVGMGLTPEGQEGNEIMYKLLLDQAWSAEPIDTETYFRQWTRNRYASSQHTEDELPGQLYRAWELLRKSAYNNTNLTSNAVPKAIFEPAPNITGLVGRTGHHPTTINYNPNDIVEAWRNLYAAATEEDASLWANDAFQHDFVDVTRQVFANAFLAEYETFIALWNSSSSSTTVSDSTTTTALQTHATRLTTTLSTLDTLLSTLPQFSLQTWVDSAATSTIEEYYISNALNQITLWGPDGEILDYASKSWGGLVRAYYLPRWQAFLGYVLGVGPQAYEASVARARVKEVEDAFQESGGSALGSDGDEKGVREVVQSVVLPVLRELGVL
ncbi:glycoside hydrolase family 89 protein [Lophiostoma macrostomum CBS 122681]|uniref:Glycoside hydrolase family 89 protein n=1 Tax=Lophiostoma macrostomum CBS 122681 TaxID=1314788 RepID=A0A6A6TD94_9PLEO|nr:glycoside hydrolase family 89 protein [Lophiostoma macrostomum CBS 122681]